MTRWRMWFSAAMGVRPTVGAYGAMDALDRRSIRRVTRLTHRGKVAGDVAEARLAVALARQTQQREPSLSAYVVIALLAIGGLTTFVVQAVQGDVDAFGVILGALGVWFTVTTIQGRLRIRNALKAEQLNLRILEGAGEEPPSDSIAQIEVPPAALVAAGVVAFFAYGIPFGALQLLDSESTLTVGGVFAKGAFFGVFMTIFQLTYGRRLTERRTERKAAATRSR
jgi:hypothetical protein